MYPTRVGGAGVPRGAAESNFDGRVSSALAHRDRIRVLVEIAAENESSISFEEILDLLPREPFPSADALRDFIAADERLSRQLSAVGEEVTLRGRESLAVGRDVQRMLAEHRIGEAERFLDGLARVCPWIELAGVSGSTAYRGAKPADDIDFFLVTRRHRLWATLLLALVAARVARFRSGGATFCFNRLAERPSCERTFREYRDPLFAREALSLHVLRGGRLYGALLRSADWMAGPFPSLYQSRVTESATARMEFEPTASWTGSLLNAASFLVLAPYLWMAALTRNVRLKREGRDKECFRTVVRRDFWATESAVFDELRDAYRRAFA